MISPILTGKELRLKRGKASAQPQTVMGSRAGITTLRALARTCTCTHVAGEGEAQSGAGRVVYVPERPARRGALSGLSKRGRKRGRPMVLGPRWLAYALGGHQPPAEEVPSLSK